MVDLNIPVGVSDFEKLRENNYYYIDKTGFISKLLQTKSAEVTLITRPRRFGKTLGMRMLASFFDIRKDSRTIFEGLEISKNTALCDEWMNQYPTLFLSFKDVDGLTFSSACDMLMYTISDLYQQHLYLLESDSVNDYDKEIIHHIAERKATVSEIKQSLVLLTKALASYYAKPVILLLDEYDVPIAKASSNGYYDQMLEIIKGMLSTSLKDNAALRFAVITGCLRIAKESIFTGTNNFVSDTITDCRLNEYFGFTQKDVEQLLRDADAIFREEMALAGLDRTTSQYFAVLTSVRSVGVMGDERTYDYTLALRAVQSQDFMTATWSRLPYELLDKVSGRIVGEVKHINRIVYDITSKPPATVEWE